MLKIGQRTSEPLIVEARFCAVQELEEGKTWVTNVFVSMTTTGMMVKRC